MGGGRNAQGVALYIRRNGRYIRNAAYKNPDREEVRQNEIERQKKLTNLYAEALSLGVYSIPIKDTDMYQDVLDGLESLAGIPANQRTYENNDKNLEIIRKRLGVDVNPNSDLENTEGRDSKYFEDELYKIMGREGFETPSSGNSLEMGIRNSWDRIINNSSFLKAQNPKDMDQFFTAIYNGQEEKARKILTNFSSALPHVNKADRDSLTSMMGEMQNFLSNYFSPF